MPIEREKIKKTIISIFVIFNIFAVLFMNTPPKALEAFKKKISTHPSLKAKYDTYSWLIYTYNHITGLDIFWKMFGLQARYNWWYLISAKYGDSDVVVLPIPTQVTRTFLENLFVDFKEVKFYLNIYTDPVGKESYARYLCRKYPEHNSNPIKSVIFDLYFQYIVPPKEAVKLGFYMYPGVYSQRFNEFKCPEIKKK